MPLCAPPQYVAAFSNFLFELLTIPWCAQWLADVNSWLPLIAVKVPVKQWVASTASPRAGEGSTKRPVRAIVSPATTGRTTVAIRCA